MNKKELLLLSSISILFFCAPVNASVSSDFILNNVPSNSVQWNNSEFDRLALDVTVPSNNGAADMIKSLSVINLQNAYQGRGIESLTLWYDEGDVGFQGMGVDKKVRKADWDQESQTWYWKDINVIVPSTGLRVFVSVETRAVLSDTRYVELSISRFIDYNGNKEFDFGDRGVFMASGNNGPTNAGVSNVGSQIIINSVVDYKAPKSVITNLANGYNVNPNESFTISGLSRDEGLANISYVKINISKDGETNNTWMNVTTDRPYYDRWTYAWTPSEGSYIIKIKSGDFSGNEATTDGVMVVAVGALNKISLTKSSFAVDNLTANADGKIRVNAEVDVKDENGNPLANKNVEISYLRASDGYIARDTRITSAGGILVWGIPTTVVSNVILSVIIDGKPLSQTYTISFTE